MPYIKGRVVSISSSGSNASMDLLKRIHLQFNAERMAWHYSWVSHKHVNSKLHVVDVMVLVERDESENRLFVAASFLSPGFTILSTKNVKLTRLAEEAVAVAAAAPPPVVEESEIEINDQQPPMSLPQVSSSSSEEQRENSQDSREELLLTDHSRTDIHESAATTKPSSIPDDDGGMSLSLLSMAESFTSYRDPIMLARECTPEKINSDEDFTLASACRAGSLFEI